MLVRLVIMVEPVQMLTLRLNATAQQNLSVNDVKLKVRL